MTSSLIAGKQVQEFETFLAEHWRYNAIEKRVRLVRLGKQEYQLQTVA